MRATVEEALRRVADAADHERADRIARERAYLERLPSHVDLTVLGSEAMWR